MVTGLELADTLGRFLDANKTRKNERQRRRADNNPQHQSLQQRAKANVRKRLPVEPGSDQEQRHGKAYSAKLIEPCEHCVKSRQQCIQERRQAEEQDEPRPLDAGPALKYDRCYQGKGHNPQCPR